MTLTLAFSPCPNDTFIFDAMIHQKIDTEGLQFDVCISDVDALNKHSFNQVYDITKLSFNAYFFNHNHYVILDSGNALGHGCGPLLISKNPQVLKKSGNIHIAIPGKHTTANLLLSLYFPELQNKTEMLFSKIEEEILNNSVDAGVIIHENRFTYLEKNLIKIADLGNLWEQETKLPIPLGCIAARRSMSSSEHQKISRVIKRSIEYAYNNTSDAMPFIKKHAQSLSNDVIQQHINLYVNEHSITLSTDARKAITKLAAIALYPQTLNPNTNIFIDTL